MDHRLIHRGGVFGWGSDNFWRGTSPNGEVDYFSCTRMLSEPNRTMVASRTMAQKYWGESPTSHSVPQIQLFPEPCLKKSGLGGWGGADPPEGTPNFDHGKERCYDTERCVWNRTNAACRTKTMHRLREQNPFAECD